MVRSPETEVRRKNNGENSISLVFSFYTRHCFCPKFLSILLLIFPSISFGNPPEITDSLYQTIKNSRADTSLVNTYLKLGQEYEMGKTDSSRLFYNKAIELAIKIKFPKGEANAWHMLASSEDNHGNYDRALNFYRKSLRIREELNDKIGISKNLGNIGIVYKNKGDYPLALENYFKGLKIDEALNRKPGLAAKYGNIAVVYMEQKEYKKALEFLFKAIKISEGIGNKKNTSTQLGNIGVVYKELLDYPRALHYYNKALKLDEETGYKIGIARHLNNIGVIYYDLGEKAEKTGNKKEANKNYIETIKFYTRALIIEEEIGDKTSLAINLGNFGALFIKLKRYKEAEQYLLKAIQLSESIKANKTIQDHHMYLSTLYEITREYDRSFLHYKKYIEWKDVIFNEEITKKLVRSEMNFSFEKKKAIEKASQEKKELAYSEQVKRQRIILLSVIIGILILLAFSYSIYKKFQISRKQNLIIEQQKRIVEQQTILVEEKQKEIIDSINYAKRIQDALIKVDSASPNKIVPEHFIIFKPKDIVSGDFFWSFQKQNYWYAAVADCTGHGVPGAFMSMLGISYLNEINSGNEVRTPAEVLDQLREKIIKDLGQKGISGENKDGMDISLVRFDFNKNEVYWAGANNPLWILKDSAVPDPANHIDASAIIEIKADKQPIGYYQIENRPFKDHLITLSKGDFIYLFSDGYADQFGGPKGKKFRYGKLKELLISIMKRPLSEQKEIINEIFSDWKGDLEQVDDVCLMLIKL